MLLARLDADCMVEGPPEAELENFFQAQEKVFFSF